MFTTRMIWVVKPIMIFYPDEDIKNLTKDKNKDIYKRDYWDKNKVDEALEQLKHIYFDMCVNQGKGTNDLVKILQRISNVKDNLKSRWWTGSQ